MSDGVAAALDAGQRLVLAGASYRAAGADAGVNEKTLRRHMRSNGTAPARARGSKLRADPDRVAELFAQDMSQVAIADALGVSKTAVANALSAAGVTRTTRRPAGRRELTDRETAHLRELWAGRDGVRPTMDRFLRLAARLAAKGVSTAAMSRAVGIGRNAVWQMLNRADMLPPPRDIDTRT